MGAFVGGVCGPNDLDVPHYAWSVAAVHSAHRYPAARVSAGGVEPCGGVRTWRDCPHAGGAAAQPAALQPGHMRRAAGGAVPAPGRDSAIFHILPYQSWAAPHFFTAVSQDGQYLPPLAINLSATVGMLRDIMVLFYHTRSFLPRLHRNGQETTWQSFCLHVVTKAMRELKRSPPGAPQVGNGGLQLMQCQGQKCTSSPVRH